MEKPAQYVLRCDVTTFCSSVTRAEGPTEGVGLGSPLTRGKEQHYRVLKYETLITFSFIYISILRKVMIKRTGVGVPWIIM